MPTPGASVAGTPLRGGSVGPGATPGRTPVRDALGLNDPDALAPAEVRLASMSRPSPSPANPYSAPWRAGLQRPRRACARRGAHGTHGMASSCDALKLRNVADFVAALCLVQQSLHTALLNYKSEQRSLWLGPFAVCSAS